MSTQIGRNAENLVAEHLRRRGFDIVDQNWRTKYCEIDIVAKRTDRIHFVEVKYRASDSAGSGLEHITAPKQRQLKRAALAWAAEHGWQGDYQIDAAGVDRQGAIDYIYNALAD